MAQYRFSVQNPVSRGKGQSAVAKAAYNAREAIRDERTGEMKDYSRKKDEVLFSGIFVDPKRNAPEWAQDRPALWNAASAAEKRKDAREAQEIILNLPHELTDQQRRFMLTDFVREQITRSTGRVADVNMHAAPTHGDDRNIHAHILMTVRAIGPEGFGEKLPEVTPEQITRWKEKWAERGAKELRKAGFDLEADRWAAGHLTLERQRQAAFERGDLAFAERLDREPTKHLGPQVAAMDRKGVETERGNIHRDTVEHNATLRELKAELAALEKQIAAEQLRAAETGRTPWEKREAGTPLQNFHRATEETTERVTAPEDLSRTAARIWEAYQRSDNAQSFVAALEDSGLLLARATKEDVRASEIDQAAAKQQGKFSPMVREGEIVAVNEQAQVYRLTPRTTGNEWRDIRKFMETLDPKAIQSIGSAKEIMQDRAASADIERQAFRDLSSVGVLKREKDTGPAGRPGRESAGKDPLPPPVTAHVAKAVEAVADLVAGVIERLGDMFGATPLTPERIEVAREAREQAAAQNEIDWARFKDDKDYRLFIEAQEAQKLESERQREYHERERDHGRDR